MVSEAIAHEINRTHAVTEFYAQNEALNDPVLRRDYFASLDANDFITLLQTTNALIRTGDATNQQPFDGTLVGLSSHDVPDQRDKEQLLRETWDVARGFLRDNRLSDEDALAYAGLVTAGGILLSHPYIDSNGRSSRVISHMIMRDTETTTESEINRLLAENGRDEWRVMPTNNVTLSYAAYPYDKSPDLPSDISWQDTDEREADKVGDPGDPISRITENRFKERALHMFMLHTDDTAREVVRRYITYNDSGQPVHLDAAGALSALVQLPEEGIGYAAQLMEAERWTRSDYVRRYLRSMQEEAPREPAGNLVNRISIIAEWADKDPKIAAQVGAFDRLAVDGVRITPRDHARVDHAASGILLHS